MCDEIKSKILPELDIVEYYGDEVAGGPEWHLHIECPVCDEWVSTDTYLDGGIGSDENNTPEQIHCTQCKTAFSPLCVDIGAQLLALERITPGKHTRLRVVSNIYENQEGVNL